MRRVRTKQTRRVTAAAALAVASAWALGAVAGEDGTPYKHEKFTLLVPRGWRTAKVPGRPDVVQVVEPHSPPTIVVVACSPAPGLGGILKHPKLRADTAKGMADQARVALGRVKELPVPRRKVAGDLVCHQHFQCTVGGQVRRVEALHLYAGGRLYIVQVLVPPGRQAAVASGVSALLASFQPQGAEGDDAELEYLLREVRKRVLKYPAAYRPAITEVTVLEDSPRKGERTVLIVGRWPRKELKAEFAQVRASAEAERRGEPPRKGPQGAASLSRYAGRVCGSGSLTADSLTPPAKYVMHRLLDPSGAVAGSIRAPAKLGIAIATGTPPSKEAGKDLEFLPPPAP